MKTKSAVLALAVAWMLGGRVALAAESAPDPVRARLAAFYGERISLIYNGFPRDCIGAAAFTNGWHEWTPEFGYGRGLEDSAILNGIALIWAVDSGDDPFARQMARGLLNLATAHGVKGFVARGLCFEDGKSACTLSSRDQITHFVHGLYHWAMSGRCDAEMKREIAEAIAAVADRMLKNVTPENEYNALTADGKIDPKGVLKMWEVRPHEAARLPMIYLAAARLTGEERYYDAYERYIDRALEESERISDIPESELKATMPGYSFLQMNASLELIRRADPSRAVRVDRIMRTVAKIAAQRFLDGRGENGPWLSSAGDLAFAMALAVKEDELDTLLGVDRARQVRELLGDCLDGRAGQEPLAQAWPTRIVSFKAAETRFGVPFGKEYDTEFPEGKLGGLVFTFDDGTVDQYEVAAPVLERYGLRAIFNIIPDRIGKPNYMTWEQLRDLVRRGHELGNHSLSHPQLNRLAETGGVDCVRAQIVGAHRMILENTGFDAKVFCYPYNASGPVSEQILKENGFSAIRYRMDNWGGRFGAKEATAAAEKAIKEGVCRYILMHGVRPGGGWAPLNDPAQFEEIVKALTEQQALWLPTYSESVVRRDGWQRRNARVKYETQRMETAVRLAIKGDVASKGGWRAVRKPGEAVEFTIGMRPSSPDLAAKLEGRPVEIRLDDFGTNRLAMVEGLYSTNGQWRISGMLDHPGFLRLTVKVAGISSCLGGDWQKAVAYDPEDLKPAGECPDDFQAFWMSAQKAARAVPIDARMEADEKRTNEKFEWYRVSFATVNDRRVHGWYVLPREASRPLPLTVQVPGAGLGSWSFTPGPRTDCAVLFMTVFPWEPWGDGNWQRANYKRLLNGFSEQYGYDGTYYSAGMSESRESAFYYPVILGIDRAVDWIAERPEIDRERIGYYGISQGGGFGLYLAMLNKSISRFAVNVPAFCDLQGDSIGRQICVSKNFYNYRDTSVAVEARRWAPYFDGANFARFIRKPIRFVAGRSDWICPATSVYAAYAVCPSEDKAILLEDGDHTTAPSSAERQMRDFLREAR